MDRKPRILGYYNYTVILTYVGLLAGFAGIILAFENKRFYAVLCLMAAGFCDMFDGAVAATKERSHCEKCFGIQIDSFSDLICFGVLPAMITYSLNRGSVIVSAICALYVLCALIRLSYFNVDEQERQKESDLPRKTFLGLPVTMSALIFPLSCGIMRLFSKDISTASVVALIVMAPLFITAFCLRKPGKLGKLALILSGALIVVLLLLAFRML